MDLVAQKFGALEFLTAENISAPHCFTTRFGGVSSGYLGTMNIDLSRGDDPRNVKENYRILGDILGFSPEGVAACHQIHSDIVHVIDESHRGKYMEGCMPPDGDALVTCTPGMVLVVFSADCTPVLLHDPVTGAVGAAHAGWRGTAAGIAQKTAEAMVRNFGCDPKDICAAIGPNIHQCCFQTDADVPEAMVAALGEEAKAYIRKNEEKYYVNLTAMNALFLRRAGVVNIAESSECTACNPDKYWSFRRIGGKRGSQGGIIVCREETK